MEKFSIPTLTYHSLSSLCLPHSGVGERLRVGFADDGSFVDVEFWDASELVGRVRWECGESDESIHRRFAKLYVQVCRVIPHYCAKDVHLLYAVVREILQQE